MSETLFFLHCGDNRSSAQDHPKLKIRFFFWIIYEIIETLLCLILEILFRDRVAAVQS